MGQAHLEHFQWALSSHRPINLRSVTFRCPWWKIKIRLIKMTLRIQRHSKSLRPKKKNKSRLITSFKKILRILRLPPSIKMKHKINQTYRLTLMTRRKWFHSKPRDQFIAQNANFLHRLDTIRITGSLSMFKEQILRKTWKPLHRVSDT